MCCFTVGEITIKSNRNSVKKNFFFTALFTQTLCQSISAKGLYDKGIDDYFKELQESTHIDEQVQWHPGGSLVRGHIHDVGAFVYVLSPLCQIHAVLETIRAHEKNTNTMKYILCLINMSDENNGWYVMIVAVYGVRVCLVLWGRGRFLTLDSRSHCSTM